MTAAPKRSLPFLLALILAGLVAWRMRGGEEKASPSPEPPSVAIPSFSAGMEPEPAELPEPEAAEAPAPSVAKERVISLSENDYLRGMAMG